MTQTLHPIFQQALSPLTRIAAENHADPTTDDLTAPLAIECARLQALNTDLLRIVKILSEAWDGVDMSEVEYFRLVATVAHDMRIVLSKAEVA